MTQQRINPLAFVALLALIFATLAGCLAPASSSSSSAASHPRPLKASQYPYHYNWTAQHDNSTYLMVKFRLSTESKIKVEIRQNATYNPARIWFEHSGISTWGRPHLFVSGILSGGSFTSCRDFSGTPYFLACPSIDLPGPGGTTGMGLTLKPGTYLVEGTPFAANQSGGMSISIGLNAPVEVLWTDEGSTQLLFLSGPGFDQPYTPGADLNLTGSWNMTAPFCVVPSASGARLDEVRISNDNGVAYDFYSQWATKDGKRGNDTAPPAWYLRSDPKKWDIGLNLCEGPGHWTFKVHLTETGTQQPPVAFLAVLNHPRIVNQAGVLDAIGPGAFNDTAWPPGSYIPSQN
jgi:hypothetical protein